MIDREFIINRALDECMTEMYAKAQPSADFHQILEDVKSGKIKDDPHDPVYNRYYLSYDEFQYILHKYIDAYGLNETWTSNIEVLERYFKGEGRKDIWIPGKVDEDGYEHPGYRSSEEVPHIKDAIETLLADIIPNENICAIAKDVSKKVFEYINNCKEYYRFDREEQSFSANVALGCSPTSNKETVINYWKEHGVDVKIKDRNPLLFWEMDYLDDEFVDVMKDTYGKDWENKTWNEYYNTDNGKKKLVNEFLRNDATFKGYYIMHGDNGLCVACFDDSSINIDIDDFIKKYKISWQKQ